MLTTCKPLISLTAAEIMTPDPVVIPLHLTLRAAAHLLSLSRVTGAPVINVRGECIGVLSATDFMKWAQCKKNSSPWLGPEDSLGTDWEMVKPAAVPEEDVAIHMTPDPVTASPSATLGTLARQMIDAHIHRVIIVDEKARPVGIVTSTDILAAVAQADPDV